MAFVLIAVPLLYSVILHEVSHGAIAYFFGDDTAKRSGRLSLNPVIHLDLVGTLALFLVGFGWAKPVPVDFSRLRPFRLGLICVSLAGCLANILIAAVMMALLKIPAVHDNTLLASAVYITARINIVLGAFNLIPIPPLDGSKILMGFLPLRGQIALALLEPYGFLILILLLFTGMLDPVIIFVQNLILAFLKLLF